VVSERIAVIDYGSGNLRSVEKAMQRAVADGGVDARVDVVRDGDSVRSASRIVLPGVGAFADCMSGLRSLTGVLDAIAESVLRRGTPFLGICVGMQLMARVGREHGEYAGLNWIGGVVSRLAPNDANLKVPHMGWNELRVARPHPLLAHAGQGIPSHAYSVHSFHFQADAASDVAADTDYGGPVVAAVARDNMFGTQFHPEKSQAFGLQLLQNFARWRP
jgi:glutamine amidotransferase